MAASTISGLGIGGSSITLQAAERAGSATGRETQFSFLSSLTSTNRLNCLGGSSPGAGAGDHSPGAYWKHQQQQFHNSTSTYPHSAYNGGGGGGGVNNSSGGNQKVNIQSDCKR